MIEKIVIDYLNKHLDVPVYAEHQRTDPRSFVLVERVGSARNNLIDRASLAIQSYAESMVEAAELNEKVKSAMYKIVKLDEIGSSKLDSDYNYTDTETKQYRYQAIFDIYF